MQDRIDFTQQGLTEEQVRQARQKYGENRLSKHKRKHLFVSFLESFGDPLIKILLIALAVNIIFVFQHANWVELVGIAVAILLATLVSTLSEHGSESAFERMQEEASHVNCRVMRSHGLVEIQMDEIVVGDIVWLQSGDRIPADGIIIYGALDVDQSALNGESKEAKKTPHHLSSHEVENNDEFLNPAALFSSSIVCAGEAYMRVTQVGDQTFFGKIGAEIQTETRESPLKLRLGELAKSIGRIGYTAAIFTALAYLFNVLVLDHQFDTARMMVTLRQTDVMVMHLVKAVMLSVTVIVMAVPEGLPMMITVVLSANMKRMLKDNVLVRKLVGIETAGSLNILFTDKTGTLTKGKLEVTHFIVGDGTVFSKQELYQKQLKLKQTLHDAVYYNTAAAMQGNAAIGGNATDRAVLEFVAQLNSEVKNVTKLDTLPFTSDTKFMTTTVSGDLNATLIKGAPEKILPYCTQYYHQNGTTSRFVNQAEINAQMTKFAQQAIRLIAVAVGDSSLRGKTSLQNLKLVGLFGIRDDIRPEAISGIRQVQSAGIQTVMITGDAPTTATAIARDIGLLTSPQDVVITSAELKTMSDQEIDQILPRLRVVARALPGDKSRLVRIAQNKELVTGMTGDGVNDAPALKQADIGFAMGSGTEVAKEAGDIVILDDNFFSITKAISYGRTIFKSIRKFIIYQLSICMCAVGVTVIGPLLGIDFPITVIQMLWINIVMDTLAGMAFSGEKARKKYMQEPPKKRNEPMLNGYMKGQIAVGSIYSTILCLVFLKGDFFQNLIGMEDYLYKLTAFFALFMFLAIFTSFCARTHSINLFENLSHNQPFLLIMGLVTVIQLFILYYGGNIFRTVRLEQADLLLIVLIAATVIPVDILRKLVIRKTVGVAGT